MIISELSFSQTQNVYVIKLKDKGDHFHADQPQNFLTPNSILRKNRLGIDIDNSDIPVNEAYVSEISSTGMKILTRSKWFNWLVAEGTEQQSQYCLNKKFVLSVSRLEDHIGSDKISKSFFNNEVVESLNYPKSSSFVNGNYDYGKGYNQIAMLNGIELHNLGFDGKGITIAVLDAGYEYADQLDVFDSLFVNNQILGTRNFVEPGKNIYEGGISSHGTMVLSTMGAYLSGELVGTAPKASYWLLRTEYAPTERLIEEYYWVAGAEFADSVGADIINSSLGYTEFNDTTENHTYKDMNGNTTIVTIGADKAAAKGILVVNSAGNEGNSPWHYIGAPADGDSVLTIGAVNAGGAYAYFSSRGPTYDGRIKPDIVTQGQGSAVANTFGTISYGSGTSFSSPIMAGMAACLVQAYPSMNNMMIISALQNSASYKDNPTDTCGFGIPDMIKAFNYLKFYSLDETSLQEVKIFPNPAIDELSLQFNKANQKVLIQVFSISGVLILEKNSMVSSNRLINIPVYDLLPGVYMLNIFTEGGNYSTKFIKK